MKSLTTKPYLINAIYKWCCDNNKTPYLAAFVNAKTKVPRDYIKDGQIVLNISSVATKNLTVDENFVQFQARFSGVSYEISIPTGNVKAIFSKECSQGLTFEVNKNQIEEIDKNSKNDKIKIRKVRKRNHLQVIK